MKINPKDAVRFVEIFLKNNLEYSINERYDQGYLDNMNPDEYYEMKDLIRGFEENE